jgi:solute:Na+ symporter, SSS family
MRNSTIEPAHQVLSWNHSTFVGTSIRLLKACLSGMSPLIKSLLFLCTGLVVLPAAQARVTNLKWENLPPLPPSAGQTKQPGVAGPFAGVHEDALIVAGGANFPAAPPWAGGGKIWWDDIWVLEKLSDAQPRWVSDRTFKLPRRLGYGISMDTADGVICAGGHDAERCYADVFMLSWDAATRTVRRTELPAMPQPLSFMAGALVGDTLYVAGGQTTMKDAQPSSVFWALDLSRRNQPAAFKWEVLPSWPGPARVLPVAAAQRTAHGMEFFLFSGRKPQAGKPTMILSDAYAFNPATRKWRTLPPIDAGAQRGVSVMAGSAVAFGDREVLIFGGDRGEPFLELETYDLAIAELRSRATTEPASESRRAGSEATVETLLAAKRKIYENHPGFARDVLAFDTRENTWRVVGKSPGLPQVTTVAVKYRDSILIPSGEIRPGIRTADIVRVGPELR